MVGDSIDSSIDVVLGWQVLVRLRRGWSFILGRRIALVHRENPLLPLILRPQPINTVPADVVFNVPELTADMTKELKVFGQALDPLETSDETQSNKTLRVHVLPKEQVLAQVINREVVLTVQIVSSNSRAHGSKGGFLQLHGNHAHERKGFHIRLVGDCSHGSGRHWLVGGIHGVNVGREGVDTIHRSRVRERRRA